MGRFLQRQIDSAESKKLGRVEHFYDYDPVTNQVNTGERPSDQATRPRNVVAGSFPVGRPNGTCKPGDENKVGRTSDGGGGMPIAGGARPALKKYRKPNR